MPSGVGAALMPLRGEIFRPAFLQPFGTSFVEAASPPPSRALLNFFAGQTIQ
jgi:hypothetical protein